MDACSRYGYQCANRFSDVLLLHDEPHLFAKSQWGNRHGYFIAYRILISAHFLFWWGYLIYVEHPDIKNFIHLTEWTLTVLNCYLFTSAVAVIFYRCKPRQQGNFSAITTRDDDLPHVPPRTPTASSEWNSYTSTQTTNLPIYFKISWLLRNISMGACPMVTIVYWGFLYHPGTMTGMELWININAHLLNSVALILDVCICAAPVRFAHFIYPFIYGFTYVLFSLLYCYFGGTTITGDCDIYPVLDWDVDEFYQTLGYIGMVTVFGVLGYSMYYLIYRMRMIMYYRYCNTESQNDLPINYADHNRYITYT